MNPTTQEVHAERPTRELTLVRPEDPRLPHLAVGGAVYTVLVSGEQTAGRFAQLDMLIPPGGGPPPHRHDFEECFRVLEGAVEVRLLDQPPQRLEVGETVNVPAGAAHTFRNADATPARVLCTVVPAGLERFFAEVGDPVRTRTSPAPALSEADREWRRRRLVARAPAHGMEVLPPPVPDVLPPAGADRTSTA